jgi:uncharacterized protein (DUF983 family)
MSGDPRNSESHLTQTSTYPAGRPGFMAALLRGLARRCPNCGRGALLRGYLKPHENCASCGLAFAPLRSDDAAPYFTILIVGHIVVPLVLLVEQHMAPPVPVQLAIWLPATALLTLALLPFVKGGVMAAIWSLKAKDPSEP